MNDYPSPLKTTNLLIAILVRRNSSVLRPGCVVMRGQLSSGQGMQYHEVPPEDLRRLAATL